jgi:archaellum component FlaC
MKKKTKKKVNTLVEKIRINLNHIESQLSRGLCVHMQRVTEIEEDVKKLDKLLWKDRK